MGTPKMFKKITLAILLVFTLALAACTPNYVDTETEVISIDYKELIKDKLYYIPYNPNDLDFHVKYETLLESESGLRVVSVAPDPDADMHNSVSGYFIFTELKE